jgi:hypothetical protein
MARWPAGRRPAASDEMPFGRGPPTTARVVQALAQCAASVPALVSANVRRIAAASAGRPLPVMAWYRERSIRRHAHHFTSWHLAL